MTVSVLANSFSLRGVGLEVSFDAAAIDGKARLHIKNAEGESSFAGADIAHTEGPFGPLLTVQLSVQPDRAWSTFTLVLPVVTLEGVRSEDVATFAVTAVHRTSITGHTRGQSLRTTVVQLVGTASATQS